MARGVCPECGGAPCALIPVCPGEPDVPMSPILRQPPARAVDPRDCRACELIPPCESDDCRLPPFRD